MRAIQACILFIALLGAQSLWAADSTEKTAVFAAGCFWCIQGPFDALKSRGVLQTRVGYSGGSKVNPTYEDVKKGDTGHLESIEIRYDSKKISYRELLEVLLKNVDPYDGKGQFCDKGEQYRSAVFPSGEEEKKAFNSLIEEWKKNGLLKEKIEILVLPASNFYPAEDYHQSYYTKNPLRYKFYRGRCGRDARLKEVWGSSAGH